MSGTGKLTRYALAAMLAAAVTGCSAGYIAERYSVGVGPTQVVLGCRDVYEVYDRLDAERMLVTSSAGTEATVGVCGTGQTRAERFRAVTQRYFLQTNRPAACRVTGTNELSALHVEFDYRCS